MHRKTSPMLYLLVTINHTRVTNISWIMIMNYNACFVYHVVMCMCINCMVNNWNLECNTFTREGNVLSYYNGAVISTRLEEYQVPRT